MPTATPAARDDTARMARQARHYLPGIAQHIVQRGNDRQPCFFTDSDRLRYLTDLRELALAHDCRVHA